VPRFRTFIALLSIALLGVDAIVGAVGHTHRHSDEACASPARCHSRGSDCCHDHASDGQDGSEHSSPQHSGEPAPHDDCTLCRHVSQPVAPVAITLAFVGSDRIEPFVPRVVRRVFIASATTHPARGPPLACA
jgi:hypothetical protein